MIDLIWGIHGLPMPTKEFRFHPTRKWRFDYCWLKEKVAVEIDGAIWARGRHTRGAGVLKDNEKINEAQRLGYRVFRFTPQQLIKGEAQAFMKAVFNDEN